MIRLFFSLIILLSVSSLQAQKLSLTKNSMMLEGITEKVEYLYQDREEQILFIDFNKLKADLHFLEVINDKGKSIMEKDVKSFRNDAIIEIDYKSFKKGAYLLRLQSPDEVIETSFNVNI